MRRMLGGKVGLSPTAWTARTSVDALYCRPSHKQDVESSGWQWSDELKLVRYARVRLVGGECEWCV